MRRGRWLGGGAREPGGSRRHGLASPSCSRGCMINKPNWKPDPPDGDDPGSRFASLISSIMVRGEWYFRQGMASISQLRRYPRRFYPRQYLSLDHDRPDDHAGCGAGIPASEAISRRLSRLLDAAP